MNLKIIGILVRKDLIDAIKTPRLLLIVIVPVIIFVATTIFFDDQLTFRVAIFTPTPSQLTSALAGAEVVRLTVFDSAEAVRQAVNTEKASLGIILPDKFDQALQTSQFPQVTFLLADDGKTNQAALSLVQQLIRFLSPTAQSFSASVEVMQPNSEEGISLRGNLKPSQFTVIIWLTMSLVGNGLMLVPTLIIEERERKTLDALLLSPASYSEVALSKALVGLTYSLLGGLVMLFIQNGLTGDVAFLLVILVAGSLALNLLGLLVGGLAKNIHTLNSFGSLLIFPLTLPAMLGLLGPNPYIQYLQFLPTYHLVQGIAYAMNGQGDKILFNVFVLSLECAVIFGAVVWSLKQRELA